MRRISRRGELEARRAQLSVEQRAQLTARLRGSATPIVPRARREGPLSFAQERFYLLEQVEPGSPTFLVPFVAELCGRLDRDAFARAIASVVARHDALRSRFVVRDGRPRQLVHDGAPIPLEQIAPVLGATTLETASRSLRTFLERPFDLAAAPPFRVALVSVGPSRHLVGIVMHHIVSDRWSMAIFVEELLHAYVAHATEAPLALPAAPSFLQYASAQHAEEANGRLQLQLTEWECALRGAPERIEILGDAQPGCAGGSEVFLPLDRALSAAIRAFARHAGVTPFAIFHAALGAWIHHHAAVTDTIVGTPFAGRTGAEDEGAIGCFINVLPLRLRITADDTFAALVARAHAMVRFALDRQHVPLERIAAAAGVRGGRGDGRLFDVLFAFQNTPRQGLALEGIEVEALRLPQAGAPFGLNFTVTESADEASGEDVFVLSLGHDLSIYSSGLAEAMLARLQALLAQGIADGGRTVDQLSPLPSAERRLLEPAPAVAIAELDFASAIDRAARENPSAIAIVDDATTLTYAALLRRSDALAQRLLRAGIGVDDRVAVALPRSIDQLVALVAVAKAGAAIVPVDLTQRGPRLDAILAEAGARAVIAAADDRFGALPTVAPVTDDLVADAPFVAPVVSPDALAYVVFTSGSTGTPKGVAVPRRSFANQIAWRRRVLALGPRDALLHTIPITFDPGIWGVFGPLAVGARIVLAPSRALSSGDFAHLVASGRVTIVDVAAPQLQALVEVEAPHALSTVRHVFCGGDVLAPELAARWLERRGGSTLSNQYGPTETTIDATAWWCEAGDRRARLPIGAPIDNVEAWVLDERMRPLPIGVPGELFIGGAGVARGYIGHPSSTAERFVPHPFSSVPGARLYRTGDRARRLPGGALEFLGRLDRQVKVRGMRIELGEIEAALHRHPGVRAVAVVDREFDGSRELIAYVVPREGGGASRADLLALARSRLPSQMVPKGIVFLDDLPRTPNGKLDREALPSPRDGIAIDARAYTAPRTETEVVIAESWQRRLGIARVGTEDEFFGIGGDSLLALREASALSERFGVEIPVRVLFEARTVAALGSRIDELRTRPHDLAMPTAGTKLASNGARTTFPCTVAQVHLLARLDRRAGMVVPLQVFLRSSPSLSAARAALDALVGRHAVLRTRYERRDDGWTQRVDPVAACPTVVHEVDPDSEDGRRLLAAAAVAPIDPRIEWPVRATLVHRPGGPLALVLAIHRIVYDATTATLIARDLVAVYDAHASGQRSVLPAPLLHYGDYAAWEAEQPVRAASASAAGPPAIVFADDVAEVSGAEECVFDRVGLNDLRARARSLDVTLPVLVAAAVARAIARVQGSDRVRLALPLANRRHADLAETVGRFATLLPIDVAVRGDDELGAAARKIRPAFLRGLDETPSLDRLHAAEAACAQVNVLSAPSVEGAADLGIELVAGAEPAPEFPLSVFATEDDDGLVLRFVHDGIRCSEATRRRVAAAVTELLRGKTAPDRRRPERIVIAGGGLGGTMLAIHLARAGLDVTIVDRLPDPRSVYAGRGPTLNLTLSQRGLAALDGVELGRAARAVAVPAPERIAHESNGTSHRTAYGARGESLYAIPRKALLELLVNAAEARDGVRFRFSQKITAIDSSGEGVRLQLEHEVLGTREELTATRLFGADGAHSATRKHLEREHGTSTRLEYSDLGYMEFVSPPGARAAWVKDLHALHVWPRGEHMMIALPNADGSFSLTLHMPFEGPASFGVLRDVTIAADFLRAHYPGVLDDVADAARRLATEQARALVTLRVFPWRLADKIVLVGDAAHAIVPYFGQGANSAFEDGRVLADCLARSREGDGTFDWRRALEAYEAARKPEADAIAQLALDHAHHLRELAHTPTYRRLAALERALAMRHPDRYATLYSMIAFTQLPYSQALARDRARQPALMRLLARCEGMDLDSPEAEALLDAFVDGLERPESLGATKLHRELRFAYPEDGT